MNYIMNSSIFTEVFAESLPQLIIFLVNEFGNKSAEVGTATFWLAFSTSLYSFLSASYPLVRHMFLAGSFTKGLATPRFEDEDLVIQPLFAEDKPFCCCSKKKAKEVEMEQARI